MDLQEAACRSSLRWLRRLGVRAKRKETGGRTMLHVFDGASPADSIKGVGRTRPRAGIALAVALCTYPLLASPQAQAAQISVSKPRKAQSRASSKTASPSSSAFPTPRRRSATCAGSRRPPPRHGPPFATQPRSGLNARRSRPWACFAGPPNNNEDCLYLNIYYPVCRCREKRETARHLLDSWRRQH